MKGSQLTASAIISFAEDLESRSSAFYEKLGERFAQHRDTFMRFARECEKSKALVTRTYRETISDALEAGFAFEGLEPRDYVVDLGLSERASLSGALAISLDLEATAIDFYLQAAERSQSLLATLPRAFARAARRRRRRRDQLESLRRGSMPSS